MSVSQRTSMWNAACRSGERRAPPTAWEFLEDENRRAAEQEMPPQAVAERAEAMTEAETFHAPLANLEQEMPLEAVAQTAGAMTEEMLTEDVAETAGAVEEVILHHADEYQDLSAALDAAQKRMARLKEQLELQRESLQRRHSKSIQVPPVLAGHWLLHQSLLDGAGKEHEKCHADCEQLQALTDDANCQPLFVQSSELQQLLKGCEDSSLRLRQGLLEAAEGSPNAKVLLTALGNDQPRSSTAHLSAALQRVARLDDQLEVQRAGFVEEKTKGLALLADALKEFLDDEKLQDEVYEAWDAQLTSEELYKLGKEIQSARDREAREEKLKLEAEREHQKLLQDMEKLRQAKEDAERAKDEAERKLASVVRDMQHVQADRDKLQEMPPQAVAERAEAMTEAEFLQAALRISANRKSVEKNQAADMANLRKRFGNLVERDGLWQQLLDAENACAATASNQESE